MTGRKCHVVTLSDGTRVRVQGDADTEFIQTLADKAKALEDSRCHAVSDVLMPEIAQRIHGRDTYRCGLAAGHDGLHRWPAESRPIIAEWSDAR